jgi:hypothetical protein
VLVDYAGQSKACKLKWEPLLVGEEFERIENGLDWNPVKK